MSRRIYGILKLRKNLLDIAKEKMYAENDITKRIFNVRRKGTASDSYLGTDQTNFRIPFSVLGKISAGFWNDHTVFCAWAFAEYHYRAYRR